MEGRKRYNPVALAGAALCAIVLAWSGHPAAAANYPDKPIKIVVGFTAGGPTDVPARYVADKLGAMLGERVVVENKPGAGTMLATRYVLSQPRDGYTLLVCTYFDPINTLLYRKPGFALSDLAPISLLAKYDEAVAVPLNSPLKSVKDFVDYTKTNPGKLTYGNLGVASLQNIIGKRLEKSLGIRMNSIPYKGGNDAMLDLLSGRLDMFLGPPVLIMPQYHDKRVRLIAVTGKSRLASAPEVPTLIESGVNIEAFGWIGLCAGSGTPEPIVKLLNEKVVEIVKSPGYQELIEKSGSVPVATTPQETQAIIDKTRDDLAPLVDEYNMHLD